jgi:hypothetical protein
MNESRAFAFSPNPIGFLTELRARPALFVKDGEDCARIIRDNEKDH